jgi:DNA-binding transcriptional MocR family regulator
LLDVLLPHDGKLFELDAPPSGLLVMLRLADDVDDEVLVQTLARENIDVQALSSHYAGRKKKQGLLLSFAGFVERDLVEAAKRLITIIAQSRL